MENDCKWVPVSFWDDESILEQDSGDRCSLRHI